MSKTYVYDCLGKTVASSRNLRGVLTHYRKQPYSPDVVVKVRDSDQPGYDVTFYYNGFHAVTHWQSLSVLLGWLLARRTWSIARVTFDAPVYDREHAREYDYIKRFRASGNLLTRHAYA